MIWGLISYDNRSSVCAQFNMKMDNDVLLLCYLDNICLILTGNLWQALASLYSGARLERDPERRLALSQLQGADDKLVQTLRTHLKL